MNELQEEALAGEILAGSLNCGVCVCVCLCMFV